jgi:Fe-S cluster assembly iron-binding protein IscA
MLTLTPTAAMALKRARSQAGAPSNYGVRFFASAPLTSQTARLTLDFVESPEPADAVTEEDGLKAYVAPEVEQLVGDAVVDVETAGQQANLVLRRQEPDEDSA